MMGLGRDRMLKIGCWRLEDWTLEIGRLEVGDWKLGCWRLIRFDGSYDDPFGGAVAGAVPRSPSIAFTRPVCIDLQFYRSSQC